MLTSGDAYHNSSLGMNGDAERMRTTTFRPRSRIFVRLQLQSLQTARTHVHKEAVERHVNGKKIQRLAGQHRRGEVQGWNASPG